LVAMIWLLPSHIMAQNIDITGKITSQDDGEPLPGVNILIKGTANGTITDADGNYSISASENSTLILSYFNILDSTRSEGL
jgi:hypothetical protein